MGFLGGLRVRVLLLLVLLPAVAVAGLTAYSAVESRDIARAEARREMAATAKLVSLHFDRAVCAT